MACAQSGQGRGRPSASRGRARRYQHDHRRVLWRHTGADRHFGAWPLADDRGARPCDRRRDSDRGHRRDARRPVDGNSDQVRASGPQHRRVRLSRRCTPSRAGAAVGRRLPVHDAVGRLSRRDAADAGDRVVGPVRRTDARDRRAAGRCRLHRPAAQGDRRLPGNTNATRSPPTAFRRWRFREYAALNTRRTA